MFSPEICNQNRRVRPPTMMGRARSRQAGITAVGVLLLALFLGLFAFATIRLTPVYLNYMKVAGVLDGVFREFDSQNPSRAAIVKSVRRRFDVESVSVITARDIKIINEGGGFKVEAVYNHTTPFIANVSFTVHFDKRVTVRR